MSVFGERLASEKAWSALRNVAGFRDASRCHDVRADGLTLVERMLKKMWEEASAGGAAVKIISEKLRAYGSKKRLSTTDPADRACFERGGEEILKNMKTLAEILSQGVDFDDEFFFEVHLQHYRQFLKWRDSETFDSLTLTNEQYFEALCIRDFINHGLLTVEAANKALPFYRKISQFEHREVNDEMRGALPGLSRRKHEPEPPSMHSPVKKRAPEEIRGLNKPREWPDRK